MKRNNGKKGFTLLELLVVVIIIGVLAAIALPSYRKAVERAKAAQAVIVLNDAAKAEQDFALVSSRYTRYWDDLIVNQPNIVKGAVYCLGGVNTDNQDDCGNDSAYKVKLTVGSPENNSIVMATRTPSSTYGDYKLFKYMSGEPTIYCKAATNSPSNICEVLGFRVGNLPETRNIDREETINCATELHGSLSNASNYTCDRVTYDDGSYDERAYRADGSLYDLFTFDSNGQQTGDTWYFEDGQNQGKVIYENGIRIESYSNQTRWTSDEIASAYNEYNPVTKKATVTLWGYLTDNPVYANSMKAFRTYDENGKWATRGDYYDTNEISGYRQYDVSANRWGYFAEYNKDGSIKTFTCYTSMCGGAGSCAGSACATSQYSAYVPKSKDLPTYETYFTNERVSKLCNFESNGVQICE